MTLKYVIQRNQIYDHQTLSRTASSHFHKIIQNHLYEHRHEVSPSNLSCSKTNQNISRKVKDYIEHSF